MRGHSYSQAGGYLGPAGLPMGLAALIGRTRLQVRRHHDLPLATRALVFQRAEFVIGPPVDAMKPHDLRASRTRPLFLFHGSRHEQ